jgi:DNA phosphorothioation-dependent restriction protein DptG
MEYVQSRRILAHEEAVDYQCKAVENAIKALWKYYEDVHNYQPGENAKTNRERKRKFFQWYQDNGLSEELDIPLAKDRRLAHLLREYYTAADGRLPTGSSSTVLVSGWRRALARRWCWSRGVARADPAWGNSAA